MAALADNLTVFADNGNSRTFVTDDHSSSDSKIVIQKRRVPTGKQNVLEDTLIVSFSQRDADGIPFPQKCSFEVKVRRPLGSPTTAGTPMLQARELFQRIVGSDEFIAMTESQLYISD